MVLMTKMPESADVTKNNAMMTTEMKDVTLPSGR